MKYNINIMYCRSKEVEAAEFVEALLVAGKGTIAVDAFNKQHMNALMFAAKKGHPRVVRMLLDAGAEFELKCEVWRFSLNQTTNNDTNIIKV
jgi:ankyrin repeat protein